MSTKKRQKIKLSKIRYRMALVKIKKCIDDTVIQAVDKIMQRKIEYICRAYGVKP